MKCFQRVVQAHIILLARCFSGTVRCISQGRTIIEGRVGRDLVQLPRQGVRRQCVVQQLPRARDGGNRARIQIDRKIDLVVVGRGVFKLRLFMRDATGHVLQFASLGVVHKQLARKHGLITQHVDLETERTQGVAELVERAGALDLLGIDFRNQQFINRVTHASHGQGCLIETQDRQHAPHLAHETRHGGQHVFVRGVAEKLIQVLLDFAKRGAQLAHHGAHGLTVAHAAIEPLHPRLQRWRRSPATNRVQSIGELLQTLGKDGIAGLEIGERSLEKQHRSGSLHRQLGRGRLAGLRSLLSNAIERVRERLALAMQLVERLGHQAELIHARLGTRHVAAREGRPVFLDRLDAPARLRQHRRVVQAESGLVVRRCDVAIQGPGATHGMENGRRNTLLWLGLGAKEQQILSQALRHALIATRQRCVLKQDARRSPLGVNIHRQQRLGQGLEKRC